MPPPINPQARIFKVVKARVANALRQRIELGEHLLRAALAQVMEIRASIAAAIEKMGNEAVPERYREKDDRARLLAGWIS